MKRWKANFCFSINVLLWISYIVFPVKICFSENFKGCRLHGIIYAHDILYIVIHILGEYICIRDSNYIENYRLFGKIDCTGRESINSKSSNRNQSAAVEERKEKGGKRGDLESFYGRIANARSGSKTREKADYVYIHNYVYIHII